MEPLPGSSPASTLVPLPPAEVKAKRPEKVQASLAAFVRTVPFAPEGGGSSSQAAPKGGKSEKGGKGNGAEEGGGKI